MNCQACQRITSESMRCLLGWILVPGWISDWSFITSVSCNKLSKHAVSAWGQLQPTCDQLCSVWRVNIVCPPTSVISILWMYLNCPTVIRRIFFLTAYFHHLTMLPLSIAHCRIIKQFWKVIKQSNERYDVERPKKPLLLNELLKKIIYWTVDTAVSRKFAYDLDCA